MNATRSFKQRLASVDRLWENEEYDQALAEVESLLEDLPGNAHLHVLRASLVQLQDKPQQNLEDAKRDLQQAVELEKESAEASIELGQFLDNVEDDPRAAIKVYSEGVAVARRLLMNGLIGQARAHRQLEQWEQFTRCLMEILQLARFKSKGAKGDSLGADVIVQSHSGDVFAVQLKGPHAEQVQDLLSELTAEKSQ